MTKFKYIFASAITFLVIGFFGGYYFTSIHPQKTETTANGSCMKKYKFINPFDCHEGVKTNNRVDTIKLKTRIMDYINRLKREDKLNRMSVYYRDLTVGQIMNIFGYEDYYSGSLLKVPIMLMYLKSAEADPALLNQSITIEIDMPKSQLLQENEMVVVGKSYTVRDLIEKMIIYSDNRAKDILLLNAERLIGKKITAETIYSDMDVVDGTTPGGVTTLAQYASLFRIIYNAEYLSSSMSDLALEILSRTAFDQGIAAGVPRNVVVANKFGVPVVPLKKEIPQLHDCGIVYHQRRPYVLCIFTEGKNATNLEQAIIEVSKSVYDEVDKVEN